MAGSFYRWEPVFLCAPNKWSIGRALPIIHQRTLNPKIFNKARSCHGQNGQVLADLINDDPPSICVRGDLPMGIRLIND